MSAQNGVIRIGRKGKIKFAFGDENAPAFEVDVIAVHDEWYVADQSMRNEAKEVPIGELNNYNQCKLQFVQTIVNKALAAVCNVPLVPPLILTHAEAGEFIAKIQEETGKLRTFFEPKLPEQPSSPESTAVRFSQ